MERLQLLEGTNGVQQAKRRARKPSGVLSPYRLSFALAGRQRFHLANLSRTLPDGVGAEAERVPDAQPFAYRVPGRHAEAVRQKPRTGGQRVGNMIRDLANCGTDRSAPHVRPGGREEIHNPPIAFGVADE